MMSHLSQESCCRAEVERVAVFANTDSVQEVTEAGLSVAHLCVQSLGEETRHLRIVATRGATFSAKSGCVSQGASDHDRFLHKLTIV